TDLRDKLDGLGLDRLDYLVVSGDLSDRATPVEFEKARTFVSKLIKRFKLSAERCVIVPGNHDVDWGSEVYDWKGRRSNDTKELMEGTFIEQARVLGVRNEARYSERFRNFSEHLYHPLVQQPYPLDPLEQCIPYTFPRSGLQFIGMNSCWQLDEF